MEGFGEFLLINGPIPKPRWTLDRVDPTGYYVPENLRWASKADQSQNRSCARYIVVDGQALTINDIADRTGRDYDAVRMSLNRHGDEHAIYLLNNPQVDPEYAWQFPEEYRDALERLFAERPARDQDISRMVFFIKLARSGILDTERDLKAANDEATRQALEVDMVILRALHSEAFRLYRHIHAAADSRRRFPNAVFPKRPVRNDEPDDSGYWPDGLR